MKTIKFSSIIVTTAALAAFSSGASATSITNVQSGRAVNQWQDMTGIQSTKTRAEIRSELNQSQSKGRYAQQEYVDFSKIKAASGNCCKQGKSEIKQSSIKSTLRPGDIYYGA